MKRKFVFMLVTVASVLVMLISAGAVSVFAEKETEEAPADQVAEPVATDGDALFTGLDKFQKIASNSEKELYMLDEKKVAVVFAVKDIKSGTVTYSGPEKCPAKSAQDIYSTATVTYRDSNTEQKAPTGMAIAEGNYKIEKIKNGVRITYDFTKGKNNLGFVVPMTYVLNDNHFDVSIEVNSVKKSADVKIDLVSISVMPYFGCAANGDEGYIFVPDGSGALIDNNFNSLDGGLKLYSTYVYGRDQSLNVISKLGHTEATTLPVFGTKVNDRAWLAVIDSADASAMIKATSARTAGVFSQCYCEFIYNKTDMYHTKTTWSIKEYQQVSLEPLDIDAATVSFYDLSVDDADYVGMAKTYRKYLTGKGVGSDVTSDLPFYAEVIGAFQKTESVFGVVKDVTKTATTFSQAEDIVKDLSGLGVKNINLRYKGWMPGGTDTTVVTNSKFESKLGSKQDLIDLNKTVTAQGGKTYLELELVNIVKAKNSFQANKYAVRDILNDHAVQYIFKRNTGMKSDYKYYLCASEYFLPQIDGFFKKFGDYGVTGIAAGSLGSSNYSNLNNEPEKYRDSQQVSDDMVKALEAIGKKLGDKGSVMVDSGNAPALVNADVVAGIPLYSSGYEMTYTDVPFAEIALHGLITYTESAHNLYSDQPTQLLRMLETGAAPYFVFTNEESSIFLNTRNNYIYTSQYKTWDESAASDYKKLADVLNGYCDKEITDHVIITDKVRATTYGDDRTVLVNYGSADYACGSVTVEAGGYAVMTKSEFEKANGGEAQ